MTTQTININAAEHPVKSVVVLKSSKAEVVRVFGVALHVRIVVFEADLRRHVTDVVLCLLISVGRTKQTGHFQASTHGRHTVRAHLRPQL
jgi:hypothetical protein